MPNIFGLSAICNSMQPPLVFIVTLNWNRREDTLECLRSMEDLDYPNKRLLLVDNGSEDNSVAAVKETFPEVEIIENASNLGFSAGTNVGLEYALSHEAQYILLLNNDTHIKSNALNELMSDMSDDVGMVAPKIYYAEDPTRIWSLGGRRHWLTTEKVGDVRGQIDKGQGTKNLERDYVAGCAILLSRNFLEDIGLFDERFFMYYEDSDLSLRARDGGYRLLISPEAHVWHKVAMSSGGSDSPNERYWMARSSVLFYRKHVHGVRWLIVLPYRLASAIKTIVRLKISGQHSSVSTYLRGLKDGLADVRNSR